MRDLRGRLDLCSINTATLGWRSPIERVIEAAARAGFGAVAPWRRELEGRDVAMVARRIRDAGLAVSGYCRSSGFPAPTPEARAAAVEDNRRAVDQAAELGAACFVLVVGSLPAGSRDLAAARDQVADGVAALLDHARAAGVRLALEPLHPMTAADRSCLCTLRQALDLCDRLDPDGTALGVAADVYHVWWDAEVEAQLARAGRRLLAFHVCDWLVDTRDLALDRGMMGDGVADIPRLRAAAEAAGYAGAVEAEIFSARNWWARPEAEVLAVCAERLQTAC